MAVSILCVMLVVPIISCMGMKTIVCTPLAFIINAGMLTAMAVNYFDAVDQLDQLQDEIKIPDRFFECFPEQF